MSELPHGDSNPLSTYAYITFQLPPPSPSHLPNSAINSAMGPTRSSHRSTRRQQASQRGRTQRGQASSQSPARDNTQLPPGYSLHNLIPRPGIADELPRPPKKSHAKRQPVGHVPRPRNAFILFRCDFVAARLIPSNVENDHRNISRIAGLVWGRLDTVQKTPWTSRAIAEKRLHKARYPDYRYNPSPSVDESSLSTAAGHPGSQISTPEGEYIIMSGSDQSASPAEYHEAQDLRMPGHRSYSAPAEAGATDVELRVPQPSVFPLPVGFFPQPSLTAASDIVVPYAQTPAHPEIVAATHEQNGMLPGPQPDIYATVPLTPYAYDWRQAGADDSALHRYHETMRQYSLHEQLDSERKPTAEELAAASYEHAARQEDFLPPQMYTPEYEYGNGPFAEPLLPYPAYHDGPELPYESRYENAWGGVGYMPYSVGASGYEGNTDSGYGSNLPGPSTPADGAVPYPGPSMEAYSSVSGTASPWTPEMI